ncbi:hypothetical protein P43SY_007956 [Pythium insidiosum]|uniref:Rhodanese domain-containing protein n=1 Tax=Pythium insidiosum TaxID=114742 RepID=A0AAD5M1L2_PYTIN|nr:hypothetical protein P43SY_007956 [Pythium insidiosum]
MPFSFALLASTAKAKPVAACQRLRPFSSLVTPAWLRESDRTSGQVRVIDCDSPVAFQRAHIPFATSFPGFSATNLKDTQGGTGVVGPREFQQLVQLLGVEKDSTIVFYDDAMGIGATRAWWVFLHYGFPKENLKVSELLTLREGAPLKETGKLVGLEAVQSALLRGTAEFVDSRTPAEYIGAQANGNRRVGHVPGAVNLDWKDAVSAEGNGRFKTKAELEELVHQRKLTTNLDQPLITYCQRGVRAAHTAFVLHEILGYRDVKIYEDSMRQYLNRDDTAIEH